MTKDNILSDFALFSLGGDGIGGWLTPEADAEIFERLSRIAVDPLTKVQLNQLFAFGHEGPVSDDFFDYYWLSCPETHPYEVASLDGFSPAFCSMPTITSLPHLKWGLYRMFVDGLLYFESVSTAFRTLRSNSSDQLKSFFAEKRFDTKRIKSRGPALPLKLIAKDDRYLISEMACKSYGDQPESPGQLRKVLIEAYRASRKAGQRSPRIRDLLEGKVVTEKHNARQQELLFSAESILDETVTSESDIGKKYAGVAKKFFAARENALANTRYYLSMVNDLDVYVATSMRSRQDFREMASACKRIFGDDRLQALQLRYFDPTLSAAVGHEDKGLIECLMVKCAKVLVYCAGEKESYGKDAEAAMALSLGKPVIFYCDEEQRGRFYRDVHPLSRLIEFDTGVSVGAMVTDSLEDVAEILHRLFENKMQYKLEQPKPGHLRLKEALTESVVRLQTSDRMLAETLRNVYQANPDDQLIRGRHRSASRSTRR